MVGYGACELKEYEQLCDDAMCMKADRKTLTNGALRKADYERNKTQIYIY